MKSTRMWLVTAGLLGLVVLVADAQTNGAQKHKGVFITRLYTGPDGQTHAEETEAKFTPGNGNDIFKMMMTTGAELHRAPAGRFSDWHTAPRRQYVITLSGYGELEVAGGEKKALGPGDTGLGEETKGKGHHTPGPGSRGRETP